jgi:uncharacterized membrane protein
VTNPVSMANIFGHQIHPMLIPFPVAFFAATFVCDVAFWHTGNPTGSPLPFGGCTQGP